MYDPRIVVEQIREDIWKACRSYPVKQIRMRYSPGIPKGIGEIPQEEHESPYSIYRELYVGVGITMCEACSIEGMQNLTVKLETLNKFLKDKHIFLAFSIEETLVEKEGWSHHD